MQRRTSRWRRRRIGRPSCQCRVGTWEIVDNGLSYDFGFPAPPAAPERVLGPGRDDEVVRVVRIGRGDHSDDPGHAHGRLTVKIAIASEPPVWTWLAARTQPLVRD